MIQIKLKVSFKNKVSLIIKEGKFRIKFKLLKVILIDTIKYKNEVLK